MEGSTQTIGVVGGGCSGAMLAIELAERPEGRPRRVVVVDSGSLPWRGVAYSTPSPSHLLNVPARQMSAHAGRPDDFVEWARRRMPDVTPASFLPRSLYGDYLADALSRARSEAPPGTSITRVHGRVVALEPTPGGATTDLLLADGTRVVVDAVVLATGNLPPAVPRFGDGVLERSDRYVAEPWTARRLEAPHGSVLLLGTGLTAVDVALGLDDLGFGGTIYAISRHGLLPRRHLAGQLPSTAPSPAASEATIRGLLAKLRGSATEEGDWRGAVDGLRPHLGEIWRRLPDAERRRFLRHSARLWEVHRHRLAPRVAERVASMLEVERLQILAGTIEECHEHADGLDVAMRERGPGAGRRTLTVSRVVNCMGPQQRLAGARDPLLDSLFASGAARPGPYGLGLDVDGEGAIVDGNGRVSPHLWAIGPLRRGTEWETTAVREIRLQAAALAARLTEGVAVPHPGMALHGDWPPPARLPASIAVVALETPGLGNHCHIASDGTVAVVVDPPRDIDRCLALAERLGTRITWVLDTHVHNDYVSGALELARVTGARYGLAAAEDVEFAEQRTGLRDGDVIETGAMRIQVVHTPGHTEHHLSYVLVEAATGLPVAVFTGGSWLHGAAGRTDLLGADKAVRLARAQWGSIRRLAAQLPDAVEIKPTHGFGSFCASGSASAEGAATVGASRGTHPALILDEESFVARLLAGHTAYPTYYTRMAPINGRGPAPINLRPAPIADPGEVPATVAGGGWLVDLRRRREFAASHLSGSLNFEGGDSFATYLGWLLPWGTPVLLAAEDPAVVAEAQRAMARIGIDRPVAQLSGPFAGWSAAAPLRSYPVARFSDLAAARGGREAPLVLDVRRDDEWRAAHLAGACHMPLPDLAQNLDEIAGLGRAGSLWVHCASGYRAAVAASWLDARGIEVVLVDDSFAAAARAGLELVSDGDRREAALSREAHVSGIRATGPMVSGVPH